MGTNGAGKSTLMDVIGGYRAPAAGHDRAARRGRHRPAAPTNEPGGAWVGSSRTPASSATSPSPRPSASRSSTRSGRSSSPRCSRSVRRDGPNDASEAEPTRSSRCSTSAATPDHPSPTSPPAPDASWSSRCQIALRSRVLLLDEPTAGVAAEGCRGVRPADPAGPQPTSTPPSSLIEHDLPLVHLDQRPHVLPRRRAGSSPKGRPTRSAATRTVIASYLGTDERAIFRSGACQEAPDDGARDRGTEDRSGRSAAPSSPSPGGCAAPRASSRPSPSASSSRSSPQRSASRPCFEDRPLADLLRRAAPPLPSQRRPADAAATGPAAVAAAPPSAPRRQRQPAGRRLGGPDPQHPTPAGSRRPPPSPTTPVPPALRSACPGADGACSVTVRSIENPQRIDGGRRRPSCGSTSPRGRPTAPSPAAAATTTPGRRCSSPTDSASPTPSATST